MKKIFFLFSFVFSFLFFNFQAQASDTAVIFFVNPVAIDNTVNPTVTYVGANSTAQSSDSEEQAYKSDWENLPSSDLLSYRYNILEDSIFIQGMTSPGTIITAILFSNKVTQEVISNADGSFSIEFAKPADNLKHYLYISFNNSTGNFRVAEATIVDLSQSSSSSEISEPPFPDEIALNLRGNLIIIFSVTAGVLTVLVIVILVIYVLRKKGKLNFIKAKAKTEAKPEKIIKK